MTSPEQLKTELLQRWEEHRPQKDSVLQTSPEMGVAFAIKDESHHPTGTYKAWHGWKMGEHYLQNHFPNQFVYYLGSTGNAGMADFHYADALNALLGEQKVNVVCFYPTHYDRKLLGPDSFGRFTDGKEVRKKMEKYASGKVVQVDFQKKYWFDNFETGHTPCLDIMDMVHIGMDITRENSLDITEGFNPTYDQLMKDYIASIPEYNCIEFPRTLMIIPFGAGILYRDCKAVALKYKLPIDFIAVSTGNKETIADKICDTSETWQKSLSELMAQGFTTARNGGDRIYHVSEQEILYALSVCQKEKIEAEPSGAAGMALIPRWRTLAPGCGYDLIATINTGNGIKECAYPTESLFHNLVYSPTRRKSWSDLTDHRDIVLARLGVDFYF